MRNHIQFSPPSLGFWSAYCCGQMYCGFVFDPCEPRHAAHRMFVKRKVHVCTCRAEALRRMIRREWHQKKKKGSQWPRRVHACLLSKPCAGVPLTTSQFEIEANEQSFPGETRPPEHTTEGSHTASSPQRLVCARSPVYSSAVALCTRGYSLASSTCPSAAYAVPATKPLCVRHRARHGATTVTNRGAPARRFRKHTAAPLRT